MRQWKKARLIPQLQYLHPEIYAQLMAGSTPSRTDTSLIEPMYSTYIQSNPIPSTEDKDGKFMHRLHFAAAILDIFCPSALYHNARVIDRICAILQSVFGYNSNQSASELIGYTRTYIKSPGFRSRVEIIASQLKSQFPDKPTAPNNGQVSLFDA